MNKKSGFSLVELIIVIAIIVVLAGILIPVFANVIDNANRSEAIANAKNAYTNYAIDHVKQDAQTEGKLLDLIYIQTEDRVVVIEQGSTRDALYGSVEEALKALCDDPDTDADESQNYELIPTEDDKLFVVMPK